MSTATLAMDDESSALEGDVPFVPNMRLSRRIERESTFLLRTLAVMLVSACAAGITVRHRDAASAEFLQHARTALTESTLDRFTWSKPAMQAAPPALLVPLKLAVSQSTGNALTSGALPSPVIGAGGVSESSVKTTDLTVPSQAASDTAGDDDGGHHKHHKHRHGDDKALIMDTADASSAGGTSRVVAAQPASTPGVAVPAAATSTASMAQTPAASAPSPKPASAGKGVEMVARSKAKVTSIDKDGVTMSSGHKIAVGSTFSSGERLLSTDPANDQFTTDKRTIVVF